MKRNTKITMACNNLLGLVLMILILGQFTSILIASDTSQAAYYPDPTQYPDHIILSWSDDPISTQSVTWRTDTSISTAYAEIARADASPNFVYQAQRIPAKTELLHFDGKSANYHSVTFTDLQSNTLYLYRVGLERRWSEWFQFRTADKQPMPFKFIYLGDAQKNILFLWSRSIRTAYKTSPDARFIIHCGDLVQSAYDYQGWNEWFTSGSWINATIPIMPVIGNHEYSGKSDEEDLFTPYWRTQFTLPLNGITELPETNYYFDFQGLRMIVLNSTRYKLEQAQWLEEILKNNPNRWTIIAFHHPIYCSKEGRGILEIRDLWNPIFKKYKVDLILNGHDHTYARGNNPERLPIRPNDPTGPVYVVSVSGPKLYNITKNRWMDRAAENTQLYQIISINNNILDYKAYTVTEELYDAFQIIENQKVIKYLLIYSRKITRSECLSIP